MDDPGAADPGARPHHLSPGQPPVVPRSPTPLDLSSAAAAAAAASYRRLSPSLRPPAHPQARLPSPYPQIPSSSSAAAAGSSGHHARSLSQPLFFSLDSLPPLPYADLAAPPAIPPSPPSSSSDPPPPGLPPRKGGHPAVAERYPLRVLAPEPAPAASRAREAGGRHGGGGVQIGRR
ncbi:hypothetical protein OsJ_28151 [Oryza sativa Japonica Group]|uniref:Uncharacterized protein n=1 Tax=Oryza sativa subsp. japonica TaxID=39947 RepID=B9FYD9_ORYSJ|nr:hypothetical protein OsJ_28151 [Oryza sativa Japonica Group]